MTHTASTTDTATGSTYGRWGSAPRPVTLGETARHWIERQVGPGGVVAPVPARVDVPASRLDDAALAALRSCVGADAVSVAAGDRIARANGCSLTDLLGQRAGTPGVPPDAVIRPQHTEQVRALLAHCAAAGIDVIAFGGGTSVVGGVTRTGVPRPAVAVAFDRMADLLAVDPVSHTVRVQPGITGPTLERLLAARGLTWGHLPQSWARASVGGMIATRSAGQASTGYGRADDTVEALTVVTPSGTFRLGRAHRSAAGPDLRQLFIGSEGALGIITEVALRVRALPTARRYEGVMLPDYHAGVTAFREVAQAGLSATVMRLSDEPETAANLAMSGPAGRLGDWVERYLRARDVAGGCLAILGWEGTDAGALRARRHAAWKILRRHGAATLGPTVGRSWRRHRYDGAFTRDALLDAGYIVETLETATTWTQLPGLLAAVRAALTDALAGQAYVMSHVSHVYETGASPYLTVVAPAAADPVAQWAAAKQAATDAIMASGGTLTHHHAVGRDHRDWLAGEIGAAGVALLGGVKSLLDPDGIMNPGVLLASRDTSGG